MAKFKAAAVFSSNMVLQREKNVRVFGTGKNGESVIVSICGNKAVTEVADEKWCVTLPAMKAGGPYEMKISNGEETIVFGNVMIGEVWLAGGQSNMELELQNCTGGKDFLANDKTENVRYYYTQKTATWMKSSSVTKKTQAGAVLTAKAQERGAQLRISTQRSLPQGLALLSE